jgi:uncharacterized membrane protein
MSWNAFSWKSWENNVRRSPLNLSTESRHSHRDGIFSVNPSPTAKPGRLQFIDGLRGWAMLFMIDAHVMNSILRPDLSSTTFYAFLTFMHGLVAPAFLFASGMAFAVSVRRKMNDFLAFRLPFWRQLSRLGLLFLIGYCLHIPKFEYHHLMYDAGRPAWLACCQVDVLQCIAMSLLILLATLLLTRTERRFTLATAILSVAVVLATPVMWSVDFWNILPPLLAEYLNGLHASLFPLFPWAAFVFGGVLAGSYYLQHAGQPPDDPTATSRAMTRFTLAALIGIGLSFAIEPVAASLYPVYDYWRTSPSFFLLRFGLIMIACAALYFYEKRRGLSASSFIVVSGRESLLIYTVHLMILYGNYGGPHFVDRVGKTLGFAGAFGVSLGIIATMVALALSWSTIKTRSPLLKNIILIGIVAGFTLVFFKGF